LISLEGLIFSITSQKYLPHIFPGLPKKGLELKGLSDLPERPIIIPFIVQITCEGQAGKGICIGLGAFLQKILDRFKILHPGIGPLKPSIGKKREMRGYAHDLLPGADCLFVFLLAEIIISQMEVGVYTTVINIDGLAKAGSGLSGSPCS
jgi:hypothetical protein